MKVISFTSLKGGVGKSASALSVAAILAEKYKVLFLDLDPQGASSCHLSDDFGEKTIRQVIKGEIMADEAIIHLDGRFDFIPAEFELSMIEMELLNAPNREFLINEIVSGLSGSYDYCVIDTPGDLGIMTRSALIASDIAVIPTQLERWGARAIRVTLEVIEKLRPLKKYTKKEIREVLIPTFYANREVQNKVLPLLQENYSDILYSGMIKNSVEIQKAFSQEGEFLKPGGNSYEEYKAFTEYLLT
jgi:chromosome partitioning protein